MFLDQYPDIPFRVLRFLVTEINYGGRVTDDKDRRLMSNLINNFLGPEVLDPNYTFSAAGAPACLKSATLSMIYMFFLLSAHMITNLAAVTCSVLTVVLVTRQIACLIASY